MSSEVSKKWGLKAGDKVRCLESMYDWRKDKLYEVEEINSDGYAVIRDNNDDIWFPELNTYRFEMIKEDEEEDTEARNSWSLKVGDKVRCIEDYSGCVTTGKIYEVEETDEVGNAIIYGEVGCCVFPELYPDRYKFQVVETGDEKMDDKASKHWGLKVGDKVRCTRNRNPWWAEGKLYEVTGIDINGYAVVVNDHSDRMFPELNPHRFEIAEKGEQKMSSKVSRRCGLKVGDKVRCKTLDVSFLTFGKYYDVVYIDSDGDAVVTDDCGLSSYPEVDDWYFDLSEFGVESEHDAKRDRLEAAVFDEIASAKTQKDAFESGARIMKIVLRAIAEL